MNFSRCVTCQNCFTKIPQGEYYNHEHTCICPDDDFVIREEGLEPQTSTQDPITFSNYPKVPEKYRKEQIWTTSGQNVRNMDKSRSGFNKSTNPDNHSYSHPSELKACQMCSKQYPVSQLEMHTRNCSVRMNQSSQAPMDLNGSRNIPSTPHRREEQQPTTGHSTNYQQTSNSQENSPRTAPSGQYSQTNQSSNRPSGEATIQYVTFIILSPLNPVNTGANPNHPEPNGQNHQTSTNENQTFQQFWSQPIFDGYTIYPLDSTILSQLIQQFGPVSKGIKETDTSKLVLSTYHKPENVQEGEEDRCTICITDLEHEEQIRKLPCNHIFHPQCVDKWLLQDSRCPMCKFDVNISLKQQNN